MRTEVFVELLTLDPALAEIPQDLPILLLTSLSGSGYMELPRYVAHRFGRVVYSTSGFLEVAAEPDSGRHSIALIDTPGQMRGMWLGSGPRPAGRPVESPSEQDRRIVSHPLADGQGSPAGRAAMSVGDMSGARNDHYARFGEMTTYRSLNPATQEYGPELDLPPVGPADAAYHYAGHGLPGRLIVPLESGRTEEMPSEKHAEWLARRQSWQDLRESHEDAWLDDVVCWSASFAGPATDLDQHRGAPSPFIADVLRPGNRPYGQTDANVHRVKVRAFTRRVGTSVLPDSSGALTPFYFVVTDVHGGGPATVVVFEPEPLPEELDERARAAGLHDGNGPATEEVRETSRRLVYALRLVLGHAIDHEDDYHELLAGIGALERMRRADPLLAPSAPST